MWASAVFATALFGLVGFAVFKNARRGPPPPPNPPPVMEGEERPAF
jgi:hypothetical protein